MLRLVIDTLNNKTIFLETEYESLNEFLHNGIEDGFIEAEGMAIKVSNVVSIKVRK